MVKNLPANAGDIKYEGSIPGSGRSPGNPLQYSCLENPTDRGAWQATVPGVTKSRTQLKQLNMHASTMKAFHSEMSLSYKLLSFVCAESMS